jgi:hypothetical protein
MEIKIGIVLNYKNAERKKDELLRINLTRMPWLENTPKEFIVMRNGIPNIPSDRAIGVYLESHFPNVIVDYIEPHEISTQRFKKNDIVFIIIYDLLEAFHLSDKKHFKKFKLALKNSKNVYPPYEYQKFINNKFVYYNYLKKKGLPIVPTQMIKTKGFNISSGVNKIIKNNHESIIIKPIYGQESFDFKKFLACPGPDKSESLECQRNKLIKYFKKTVPKYDGLLLQKYIKGFDKSNPEMRTFFINGQYFYTMATTNRLAGTRPKQEGGHYIVKAKNWKFYMKFSRKVMKRLPKLDLPGKLKSPILTRIDIGTGLQGVPFTCFVNEVEFVPSLYIEDQKHPVLENIAESLYKVSKIYHQRKLKGKLPVKVKF